MRCPKCKRELPPPSSVCPHDGALLLAPLLDTLKRGPLPLSQATRIVEDLCRQLEPLHASGGAHGRIAPENVFFRHVGSDLIARLTEANEDRPLPGPRYATPERVRGDREDWRADIYALGVLLHHLIAGAPPFDSGTEAAILKKHAEAPPPSLLAFELQDVPIELDTLMRKMLAKHPEQRPQRVADVRERLENIDLGSTISGVKLASLAHTDSGSDSGLMDEPTIETAPVYQRMEKDRESLNPTVLNIEKKAIAPSGQLPTVIAPPPPPPAQTHKSEVSLPPVHSPDVDPYGDTVLRARPTFTDDSDAADTFLKLPQIQAEIPPSLPPRAPSGETEPPTARPPQPVRKPDLSPRGPTLRTPAPPGQQQTKLAILVVIGALAFAVTALLIFVLTR